MRYALSWDITPRHRGTRWRSWLRHCATNRKVAGSIPDGVIGIFHWHNPSGRTMTLGLTQPLTEVSTRNISWGKRRPVRRADNITTFMCRLSWNLGASTSWNPQGLSRPVMRLLYLYATSSDYWFPWSWDYYFVSKRRETITKWRGFISQNDGYLSYSAA